jgi:hypothetical protein
MPPTRFVPEVPHARLAFDGVAVAHEDVLPGDGYERYIKPFRSVEDIHVTAAVLAYLLAEAGRRGWPASWRERALIALLGLRGARRARSGGPADPSGARRRAGGQPRLDRRSRSPCGSSRPTIPPASAGRATPACSGWRRAPASSARLRAWERTRAGRHDSADRNCCSSAVSGWLNRLRWAHLMDAAGVHEHDAVGHLAGEVHLVRDHQQRHALVGQRLHHPQHLADQLGVEREVISSHSSTLGSIASARAMATRCCWPPESWSGQASNFSARPTRSSSCAQGLGLGAADLLHQARGQHDVAAHGQVREQVEVLEDHAHVLAQRAHGGGVAVLQRLAVHRQVPLLEHLQAVDAAQQRALARAALADDGDDLAAAARPGRCP